MSDLYNLIKELCPEGVQYKALSEICEFQRGTSITKKDVIDGNVPVIAGGQKPAYYHNVSNRNGETIVVSSSGAYAGFVSYWNIPVFLSDSFSVNPNKSHLTPKFVFYFLKSIQEKIHDTKKGGGVPHVHGSSIANFLIPIPPFPVQEEIVRILDNFMMLSAELSAELSARKKQYEYYRNKLMTFGDDVPKITFGETCSMKSGKSISASKISTQQDKNAPFACFGGNGIRGFVKAASHHGEFPIIGRQGALCGNVNYATGDFYATEHAVVVKSLGKYNQRFLFHLLTVMNLNQYKSQGAQPGLAVGNLENLLAPVPPLNEQQRIVSILDRFDTLCNDLTNGLPAEIQARRKQYEYYRDKLLTFQEA